MRLICGIDPGLGGAIAFLTESGEFRYVADLPIVANTTGRNQIDGLGLAAILRRFPPTICLVERVGPRPGEGATGAFSFGHSVGVIQGVLATLEVPYQFVQPSVWKRQAGIPPSSDKAASIAAAKRLIPTAAPRLTLRKHDGRAESLLIARHALTLS